MRQRRPVPVLAWVALACVPVAAPAAAEAPCTMRVESELFTAGESEPVARSLTVFRDGLAWDFLELSPASDPADTAEPTVREIVLHDPARERVVVIDPARHLKTEIGFIRLERLSVSLANWARTTDDKLVRWAGGPDFGGCFSETEDGLELVGPRVRYAVAHVPAVRLTLSTAATPNPAATSSRTNRAGSGRSNHSAPLPPASWSRKTRPAASPGT